MECDGIKRRSFLGMVGAILAFRSAKGVTPSPGLVINFEADLDRACLYDIFDATTGENINHLQIWYADEGRGIIRAYRCLANERRCLVFCVDGNGEPITDESRRDIRIRLKSKFRSEAQGLAYNAEQWRRLGMGLEADLP